MKIVLLGNGGLPIPPVGWGAVEIIICDMYIYLKEMGQEVHIINTKNKHEIISRINDIKPDGMLTAYSINLVRNSGVKDINI